MVTSFLIHRPLINEGKPRRTGPESEAARDRPVHTWNLEQAELNAVLPHPAEKLEIKATSRREVARIPFPPPASSIQIQEIRHALPCLD